MIVYPANLLSLANTDSNSQYLQACREHGIKPNPARLPHGLPEFFVKFLTDPGDLVVDPFAGSNVTGEVAERLERRWLAFEIVEEYLKGSRFRFPELYQQDYLFGQRATPTVEATVEEEGEEVVFEQALLLESEPEYEVEEEEG
jgi:DNA modification methylase